MARSRFVWDVFISHNRAQKRLVRALVHQWRELGLKVFFDEDTIQAGEHIVSALEGACTKSRNVVLLITPESLSSRWIALELQSVADSEPTGAEHRLIPVVLEPVEESQVPTYLRGLEAIDLTNPKTRRDQYHRLLKSLGVDREPPPDLPRLESEEAGATVSSRTARVMDFGPLSPSSRYYIEREVDRRVLDQLQGTPGATVIVQGSGQSGKSSLLARVHAWAFKEGRAPCYLAFEGMDARDFETTDNLFLAIARSIVDGLNLDTEPSADWSSNRGPKRNLTRFVERQILGRLQSPVLFLFDDADMTFTRGDVCQALFSMLRSWHNSRATDLQGRGWARLGLIVAYSLDSALWIPNLNESPFNVGLQVVLHDFNASEVSELNERLGRPLHSEAEVKELMELVGGHPFLVRQALGTMNAKQKKRQDYSFDDLKRTAIDEEGPFAAHLRHRLTILDNDQPLKTAVRGILRNGTSDDELVFQRLRSIGLVRGETRDRISIRNKLYQEFFAKRM